MNILTKQWADLLSPKQTFIIGSEIPVHVHRKSDQSDFSEGHHLIPKIREFECFETRLQSLENEIQIDG